MNWNIFEPSPYNNKAIDELDVFLLSKKLEVPQVYRNYLLKTNGGIPKKTWFYIPCLNSWSKVHHMYGLHDGPNYRRLDFAQSYNQIGGEYLLIGDDPQGSQITICLSTVDFRSIWYWDHNSGELMKLADSFELFIGGLESQNPSRETTLLDDLLENDDVEGIKEFINNYGFNYTDDLGRTIIENSAIQNSMKVAEYLISERADTGKALEYAEKNAFFFPEFVGIKKLLKDSLNRD